MIITTDDTEEENLKRWNSNLEMFRVGLLPDRAGGSPLL